VSGKLTIEARLTRDPEKRVTNNGKTMAVFGIANNERIQDPNTKEWSDGDPMFLDVIAWPPVAEPLLESGIGRGDLVVIEGTLRQRWWEDKDGQKRSKYELTIGFIGSSLRFKNNKTGAPQKSAASSYDDAPPF
jgi:single-strand DNA-binding protein